LPVRFVALEGPSRDRG